MGVKKNKKHVFMQIRYVDAAITFAEVPDEISLCINITGCPFQCAGCHSPYLHEPGIGHVLDSMKLRELVNKNPGITCVCLLGGDLREKQLNELFGLIKKEFPDIKTAWYSGQSQINPEINLENLDYIKIGPWDQDLGPLNSESTNQQMFRIVHGILKEDITKWFQNKKMYS